MSGDYYAAWVPAIPWQFTTVQKSGSGCKQTFQRQPDVRFWQAGAGVDWKWPVDAGSAWVFGVEYLHYGFGDQTITLTDNTGRSLSVAGKENVDTVKGRISYLFSIH